MSIKQKIREIKKELYFLQRYCLYLQKEIEDEKKWEKENTKVLRLVPRRKIV